jgi:transposase
MSQSLLYHALGVREGYDYVETQYQDGGVRFVLSVRPDWITCPACGSKAINRKGRRFRELQTVPIGLKPVFLVTEIPKCQCAACGKRFEVSPPLPRSMSTTRTGSKRSLTTCAD